MRREDIGMFVYNWRPLNSVPNDCNKNMLRHCCTHTFVILKNITNDHPAPSVRVVKKEVLKSSGNWKDENNKHDYVIKRSVHVSICKGFNSMPYRL